MLKPNQKALCDLVKITEEEYLSREFGLKLEYSQKDREFESDCNIVISDNPQKWSTFLRSAPTDSIIFFLIGNETYEPVKYQFLNSFASIRCALIYNPPRKVNFLNIIKTLLGNVADGGLLPSGFPGSVFRDFRTSQFTRRKLKNIDFKYPYIELPQGYCNSFVAQLSRLSTDMKSMLETNVSLFSPHFQEALSLFIDKKQNFS